MNLSREEIEKVRKFQEDHPEIRLPLSSSAWVALAQHKGYETRLLDFTRSPCVALFFACWTARPTDEALVKDSVVFLVLPSSLRPQTMSRDRVEPGDIEQGIPCSFYELFEPWALAPVHDGIAHMYIPSLTELGMNDRLRAQDGLFLWWNPPEKQMHCQWFPIVIKCKARSSILKELGPLGFRPSILFPDEEGKKFEDRLANYLRN